MVRLALQRLHANKITSFEKQQSRIEAEIKRSIISTASGHVVIGSRTVFRGDLIERFPAATLSHLQRIADYLEVGKRVWYTLEDNDIVFRDGKDDLNSQDAGQCMTSFL